MKTEYIILYSILGIFTGCNLTKQAADKEIIISKIHNKRNDNETDTLRVSQNDTTVFKQVENINNRPCSNPEITTVYELREPNDGAYYYIYNSTGKLVMEGKYTKEYLYEGVLYEHGNFYNSVSYYYKKNGKLKAVHYQQDGRNLKTEFFDSDKILKEVIYFDKKSSDKIKVEIYDKGQLDETRIYTSFDNYYTVKAQHKL